MFYHQPNCSLLCTNASRKLQPRTLITGGKKKRLSGADLRRRRLLCNTLIMNDLRQNGTRHLPNVCERDPTAVSGMGDDVCGQNLLISSSLQIGFYLTKCHPWRGRIPRPGYFSLFSSKKKKQSKHLHPRYSESTLSVMFVNPRQPSEWKVLRHTTFSFF